MGFTLQQRETGLWVGAFSLFPKEMVAHGISTRFGGVSEAPFDSLNLALHVGDVPAAVVENRRRFCRGLGLLAEHLCAAEQVHGVRIVRVTGKDAGRGWCDYGDAVPKADALMTDVPGVPMLLCYADCTPVLILDPVRHAAAAVHAGWRGTVQGIAAKTVQAMHEAFGTEPRDCLAAIGPAIGGECYEVGQEIAEQFQQAYSVDAAQFLHDRKGRVYLDLEKANRLQLEEAGLSRNHIDMANACTVCNSPLFFSYRADKGHTGRIGAVIALK